MPVIQLQTSDGHDLTINARRESTVIMRNGDTSFTFDAEGRFIGAFLDGRNYRRSLDNRILEKAGGPRPGLSGRLRRLLEPGEVEQLEGRAYACAASAGQELSRVIGDGNAGETARLALARIATYDYARLEREREIYRRVYRPVTILPPDQYLALYLQVTEGCAYNHCRFCGFYRDRNFRVKSLAELKQHILDIRALFGRGLSLRRSIFLGDANALMVPQANLLPMFDLINAEFAIGPRPSANPSKPLANSSSPDSHLLIGNVGDDLFHFNGIYSFMDAVGVRRRSPADYAALAARGLRRVYIGLESGDPYLLRFLGKPHTPKAVFELVEDLKAGGVAVGVIVLIGAGGKRYEEAHVRETARLLNAMPLDAGDLIYFSEMIDYPGSTYAEQAAAAGIAPLTVEEMESQMERLRSELVFSDPARAPKISYYDIREFVY